MDKKKLTRIKQCHRDCDHFATNGNWPWPRCIHPDRPFELGDNALDGPDADCPAGFWTGLDETKAAEYLSNVDHFDGMERRQFVKNDSSVHTPVENEIEKRRGICRACERESCPLHKCDSCFARARLTRPQTGCHDVGTPRWLPIHPGWYSPIKVTWVISAWNDPHVPETIRQLKASIIDPAITFDVILIDDGSDKEDYSTLDCTVIRNDEPKGIGYNLNVGTKKAIEMGADVIGVADAHMKIPAGAVDYISRRAMVEDCVTCSATYGWEDKSKFAQWGAYLVQMANNLIEPKWMGGKWPYNKDEISTHPTGGIFHHPEDEWAQVQVPLGAFYAYSKATVNRLMAPTGRLWETPVGRWGFLLAPFSTKCYLLDIPTYVSRDHYTRHLYRKVNPLASAGTGKVYNIAYGMASIFSEETLDSYMFGKTQFKLWVVSRGGVDGSIIMKHIADARKGVKRPWTPEDEKEFLDSIPWKEPEDKAATAIPLGKIKLRRDKMMRPLRTKENSDGLDA